MMTHRQNKSRRKIWWWVLLLLFLILFIWLSWWYCHSQQVLKVVGSQQHLSALLQQNQRWQNSSRPPWGLLLLSPALLPVAALDILQAAFLPSYFGYRDIAWSKEVLPPSSLAVDYQQKHFDNSKEVRATSLPEKNTDYATTNLQVANVDEADIVKTDGNYLYSLSEDEVIIADVRQTQAPQIAAKLKLTHAAIPEDLFLWAHLLVVVGTNPGVEGTVVNIYNLQTLPEVKLVKQFTLKQRYFTARITGDKLYVLAKDSLRSDDFLASLAYSDNETQLPLAYSKLYHLPDLATNVLSMVATLDLHSLSTVQVHGYLLDLQQAYVSSENLYLISQDNHSHDLFWENFVATSKTLFTWKGVWGVQLDSVMHPDRLRRSQVYKFKLADELIFVGRLATWGESLNQFSFDEDSEGNFRLALNYQQDNHRATKIEIYDQHLHLLGSLNNLAPGERMYAARFIGNRVYLVTYKTMDPLFVVDLANKHAPKVLGELKIPGYSTYLHPYDDNHLLGFGISTTEHIDRDDQGRVLSTSATRDQVKIALFDVSNVSQPKELAVTTIGDSYTSSSVLTNHKALLFSREKNLLAIPVNNYRDADNRAESSVAEGYWVYHLNLKDGFKFKGAVVHDEVWCQSPRLLRGVYIHNNLYTLSSAMLKINSLADLQELATLTFGAKKQCPSGTDEVLIKQPER